MSDEDREDHGIFAEQGPRSLGQRIIFRGDGLVEDGEARADGERGVDGGEMEQRIA